MNWMRDQLLIRGMHGCVRHAIELLSGVVPPVSPSQETKSKRKKAPP